MYEIGSLVTAYNTLPTAKPDDRLGSSLEHTNSSHDIVLVFDEKEIFLGILAPSFAYFKKRYPNETKVRSAMITPPHLRSQSSIFDTAEQMLSIGAYTLPIFDDHTITGLISARYILKGLLKNKDLLNQVKRNLKLLKPHLIPPQTKIRDIYAIIKNDGSRILVVDKEGAVEGIITRRDIQNALVAPTRKNRFAKSDPSHTRTFSFDEEKLKRLDYFVTELYNTTVVSLPEKAPLEKVIQTMIDNSVNSVVLIDFESKPTGIISVRTILEAIEASKPEQDIPIKVSDQHSILSTYDRAQIEKAMVKFAKKVKKYVDIQEFSLDIDASQNRSGKISNFEVNSNISSTYPGNMHSHAVEKTLMKAVKSSIKKIENQLD